MTPTTQDLLKFWFSEEYCSLRNQNFHAGQRQAILNIIYLHEVAGNDLGMLDRRYLRGSELEYLAELKDIMVINDEAHHIHELKRNGEIDLRPPAIMSICKVSLSAAMGELFV